MFYLFNEVSKYAKRLDQLKETIAQDPNNPEGHLKLGLTYAEHGKYREAIRAYTRALQLDSTFVVAYRALGDVYQDQGMDEKAGAYYRKAVEVYRATQRME